MNRANDYSVVVPALDEERYLPRLLAGLAAQTIPPREVIVVDAGSSDRTLSLAREAGALAMEGGGLPGPSRNLGADRAGAEWILFADADVGPAPETMERLFAAQARLGFDAACCFVAPDPATPATLFLHRFLNLYYLYGNRVGFHHGVGGFLLVRRALHQAVGGFDPGITVAEENDYINRLARAGRYRFLRRPQVRISSRRFLNEGPWRMAFRYMMIEFRRMTYGEFRRPGRMEYFGPGPGKGGRPLP